MTYIASVTYDCTGDVLEHKRRVKEIMSALIGELVERAYLHDLSKLEEPEKSIFDQASPVLKIAIFGSPEYNQALQALGDGLQHHYENNRHHPEHFDSGLYGMNLLDVLEMVCDWRAAAEGQAAEVNLTHLAKRFGIDEQLYWIIWNTLQAMK